MGQPKKRTSSRRTGSRRSHLVLRLARRVNATSPVPVYTTKRESAKPKNAGAAKTAKKSSPAAVK